MLVMHGFFYRNKKTKDIYMVSTIVKNANNGQEDPIVIYRGVDGWYGRNLTEFREKFEVYENEANT